MSRPAWDFEYVTPREGPTDDGGPQSDLIVATGTDVDPVMVTQFLTHDCDQIEVKAILSAHPLYWTRVTASLPLEREALAKAFERAGSPVRYVASACHGSQALAPGVNWQDGRPQRASDWKSRPAETWADATSDGNWFLREAGVAVDRAVCGTGAGAHIAVVDNDGGASDNLGLDAEVLIGVDEVPRSSQHSSLLIAWATGTHPDSSQENSFGGVAPDASPRLYCIPKPGSDVFQLPVAIVRAVNDGADVIVCATYVSGLSSPMLDDALEFAYRLGRGGRGAAVLMPTGRDVSSTGASSHASLTLRFGDPACDPRVFCIGPSSRRGDWFLWRDRHGKLRPFANRGPAVRWLAPGDDVGYPLADKPDLTHAESSGASGFAAGVIALVLASNPTLTLSEVERVLTRTASAIEGSEKLSGTDLADPLDVLPAAQDADGHNPKHGYGRLSANSACATVADPIAAALVQMGEQTVACRWLELRSTNDQLKQMYSRKFAWSAARLSLTDATVAHALSAITRHGRLISLSPERRAFHSAGSTARQLAIVLRLMETQAVGLEPGTRQELASLRIQLEKATQSNQAAGRIDDAFYAIAHRLFLHRPSLAGAA